MKCAKVNDLQFVFQYTGNLLCDCHYRLHKRFGTNRYLNIGRCVVRQSRRGQPVFRWFGQVFRDEPEEFRPALEVDDLAGGALGQPLEARVGGQGQSNTTTAQQEPDLLGAGVLNKKNFKLFLNLLSNIYSITTVRCKLTC